MIDDLKDDMELEAALAAVEAGEVTQDANATEPRLTDPTIAFSIAGQDWEEETPTAPTLEEHEYQLAIEPMIYTLIAAAITGAAWFVAGYLP